MPKLVANLHFHGRCERAMALYSTAFGARVTAQMRYRDADPRDFDEPLTEAQGAYIYHGEMEIYGQRVMMSDRMDEGADMSAPSVSLVIVMETQQQVRAAYGVLGEGALKVLSPPVETTYSSAFVSFVDRFGIRWELMTET